MYILKSFQKKTFPSAQVGQVNPPKFEKCDDMVNLTYLNDASVFHNLEGRYKAKLIHTCKLTFDSEVSSRIFLHSCSCFKNSVGFKS